MIAHAAEEPVWRSFLPWFIRIILNHPEFLPQLCYIEEQHCGSAKDLGEGDE